MAKKTKSKREFILNEPQLNIKNGSTRKSVKVAAKEFPVRARREKINQALLIHDMEAVPEYKITEKDIDLLKQIAFEGTLSNNLPALRYNAIIQLASFQTADTLNTLSYLANHGEDCYIKSYALMALGKSGIELSIPVIAKSMSDKNILIRNSAQKALIRLVNTIGIERVKEYFISDNSLNNELIENTIEILNKKKTKKHAQTKSGE